MCAQIDAYVSGNPRVASLEIGHALNMLHTAFILRFDSVDNFRKASAADQNDYLEAMGRAGDSAVTNGPQGSGPELALAIAMYSVWAAAIANREDALERDIGARIAKLSKFASY
jgi:hypothetical protein